jgi:hypothetical protein
MKKIIPIILLLLLSVSFSAVAHEEPEVRLRKGQHHVRVGTDLTYTRTAGRSFFGLDVGYGYLVTSFLEPMILANYTLGLSPTTDSESVILGIRLWGNSDMLDFTRRLVTFLEVGGGVNTFDFGVGRTWNGLIHGQAGFTYLFNQHVGLGASFRYLRNQGQFNSNVFTLPLEFTILL